jgi:hypothetical protein
LVVVGGGWWWLVMDGWLLWMCGCFNNNNLRFCLGGWDGFMG